MLACGLGLSIFLFWRDTNINARIAQRSMLHRLARQALARNPDTIEGWMTFDYIDHIFSFPPGYLKAALNISDSRYPRLTIDAYAKSAKIPEKSFLESVRAAAAKK